MYSVLFYVARIEGIKNYITLYNIIVVLIHIVTLFLE